jgi:hypothetical protein
VTPEQLQQLELLKAEVAALKEDNQRLKAGGTISYEVEQALASRFKLDALDGARNNAPRAAITAPIGGVTIDTQARTAINSIITALEELKLVAEN